MKHLLSRKSLRCAFSLLTVLLFSTQIWGANRVIGYAVLSNNYDNVIVDNGDGTTTEHPGEGLTLTFYKNSQSGKINFEVGPFYSDEDPQYHDIPWKDDRAYITKVVFDSSFKYQSPYSCARWFNGCYNLKSIEGIGNLDTHETTNMFRMFCGCSKLKRIDVSGFNTQNVTNMGRLFQDCDSLEGIEGLEKLDVSKVNQMQLFFWNCKSLPETELLKVASFENTSSLKNISYMFASCPNLTKFDSNDFSKWTTSLLTLMPGIFLDCENLETVDLSKFNTSAVTDMHSMFRGCKNLTKIAFGENEKFETSSVQSMCRMFYDCNSLTSLDVTGFDTKNVTSMYSMFQGCNNLKSLTFGKDFSTDGITSYVKTGDDDALAEYDGKLQLWNMFAECPRMRYIDFYASDDTNAITEVDRTTEDAMFYDVPRTTVIYLPHGSSSVTDAENVVYTGNDPMAGGGGHGGGAQILKCPNYYSEDKVDIEFPHDFRTNKAEYSRTMTATQYGTAILPYAFTSNDDVQAYTLNQELTEQMYFVEAETVPAHTPFFYKKKNPTATSVSFTMTDDSNNFGIAVEATHTTSAAEGGEPYETGSGMEGWNTRGYYVLETITANNNGTFYISGDKFLKAMGTVKMNPHRVTFHGEWLKGEPSTSEGASYMDFVMMEAPAETEEPTETQEPVVDENLPEEVITAIEAADLRKEVSEASAIYDAQGRTRLTLQKGLNLIRKQDGTVKKVFLK